MYIKYIIKYVTRTQIYRYYIICNIRRLFTTAKTGNKQNIIILYQPNRLLYIGIRIIKTRTKCSYLIVEGSPVVIPLTVHTEEDRTESHY